MTKLSILILTHNRPDLFQRCLHSVLSQLDDRTDVEIIVNNDSNDIREINDSRVTYYYKSFEILCLGTFGIRSIGGGANTE